MDKKGLNFIVGIGGIWLIWRLWSTGFLHSVGFMAVNSTMGTQELQMTYSAYGDVTYGTPLAAFAAVLIDSVAIFGSVLVMLLTGLWQTSGVFFAYLGDLFALLRFYIDKYMNKNEVKTEEEIVEDVKKEKELTQEIELGGEEFYLGILGALEEFSNKQEKLTKLVNEKLAIKEEDENE